MTVANLFREDLEVVNDPAQRRFTDDQEVVAECLEFVEKHTGNGEWGMGSREWGKGAFLIPHSLLPIPHSPLNFKMRKFLELMETGVNLFGLEPAQSIATELLDVVGGHNRAVDDGAAQRGLVDLVGLRQIPHEAAREAVAGAGRVEDVFERVGRD